MRKINFRFGISDELAQVIDDNGIVITCTEDANLAISEEDLEKIISIAPEVENDIVDAGTMEVYSCTEVDNRHVASFTTLKDAVDYINSEVGKGHGWYEVYEGCRTDGEEPVYVSEKY